MLTELYEQMKETPTNVDLADLWHSLGSKCAMERLCFMQMRHWHPCARLSLEVCGRAKQTRCHLPSEQ